MCFSDETAFGALLLCVFSLNKSAFKMLSFFCLGPSQALPVASVYTLGIFHSLNWHVHAEQ